VFALDLDPDFSGQLQSVSAANLLSQTTAAMAVIGMTCKLTDDSVVVNGDLKISFRRTVRVPETKESNWLPPDLGAFPLKPVSQHSKNLPPGMAVKGGVLFPMYRKCSQ
jgi:hypothetical protein